MVSECHGEKTAPRAFNLMFQTYVGPVQDESAIAYLRPETAQAIFAQFKNVLETSRQKVPFGIAQVGKAFRNEVTPRNYTFRSREFEQMELEFFIKPDEVVEAIQCSVSRVQPGSSELKTETLKLETSAAWGWEANGTNIGSRSGSNFTRASACRGTRWWSIGKSRRNWRITPAPAWTFSSSSRSASAMKGRVEGRGTGRHRRAQRF